MFRLLAALLLVPAAALAEPVFVPGGRVGLEPPAGFALATRFNGFEHPATQASFIVAELPREAWPRLRGSMTDKSLAEQGIEVASREDVMVAGSDAILLRGTQTVGATRAEKWILAVGYPTATAIVTYQVPEPGSHPAEAVRAALMSATFRAPVSIGEQVAALPFTIGALGDFRVERVIAGNTVIMVEDAPPGRPQPQPIVIVAAASTGAPAAAKRDEFARVAILGLTILDEVVIESSAPAPVGGDEGHELVGQAVDRRTGQPVGLVQWLRFAGDGYIRYVGIGPIGERDRLLPKFREVRDAVVPRAGP